MARTQNLQSICSHNNDYAMWPLEHINCLQPSKVGVTNRVTSQLQTNLHNTGLPKVLNESTEKKDLSNLEW
jgi:hypothetical protein